MGVGSHWKLRSCAAWELDVMTWFQGLKIQPEGGGIQLGGVVPLMNLGGSRRRTTAVVKLADDMCVRDIAQGSYTLVRTRVQRQKQGK